LVVEAGREEGNFAAQQARMEVEENRFQEFLEEQALPLPARESISILLRQEGERGDTYTKRVLEHLNFKASFRKTEEEITRMRNEVKDRQDLYRQIQEVESSALKVLEILKRAVADILQEVQAKFQDRHVTLVTNEKSILNDYITEYNSCYKRQMMTQNLVNLRITEYENDQSKRTADRAKAVRRGDIPKLRMLDRELKDYGQALHESRQEETELKAQIELYDSKARPIFERTGTVHPRGQVEKAIAEENLKHFENELEHEQAASGRVDAVAKKIAELKEKVRGGEHKKPKSPPPKPKASEQEGEVEELESDAPAKKSQGDAPAKKPEGYTVEIDYFETPRQVIQLRSKS